MRTYPRISDYALAVTALIVAVALLATLAGCTQEDTPPTDSEQEEEEEGPAGEEEEEDEPPDNDSDTPPDTGETEEDPEPPVEDPKETLESKIYERLKTEVPLINEFPERVADGVVNQIKTTIYDTGFAENEQRAWDYIRPAVQFGLEALANIDFTKYKNIDVNQLSEFENYILNQELHWDKYSDAEIGNVLLPINLGKVNLHTGEKTIRFSLETALINVTPNAELDGKSPQEWVTQLFSEDYGNRPESNDWAIINLDGLDSLSILGAIVNWEGQLREDRPGQQFTPYEWAIIDARAHTNGNAYGVDQNGNRTIPKWSNSNDVYQKAVNELLAEGDDLATFLRGYPIALVRTGRIASGQLDGDSSQFYSAALANLLGIPAEVVEGIYPTSSEVKRHREVYVFNPNYRNDDPLLPGYLGFWLKKGPFKKDYENKPFDVPSVWTLGMNDEKAMPILP